MIRWYYCKQCHANFSKVIVKDVSTEQRCVYCGSPSQRIFLKDIMEVKNERL